MKYTIRVSCLEIYHEHVYDLLVDERDRVALNVREHSSDGFFLEGARLAACPTMKDASRILDMGMRNRQIGEHDLNSRSNRSHCITDVFVDLPRNASTGNTSGEDDGDKDSNSHKQSTVETVDGSNNSNNNNNNNAIDAVVGNQVERREFNLSGRITFVDLAGSERLKSTQSTGKVLQEAGFINRSLYVLGKVIAGLVRTGGDRNHKDVPYRDSKLTKLLIESLGGRSRSMLIACVTEGSASVAETLRTLKFRCGCLRIENGLFDECEFFYVS